MEGNDHLQFAEEEVKPVEVKAFTIHSQQVCFAVLQAEPF